MEFVQKKDFHIHQNNLDHGGSEILKLDSDMLHVTTKVSWNTFFCEGVFNVNLPF